mgnify:CR=1 FL=1
MVEIFLALVVPLIVLALVYWLITLIPLPEPFPKIILILVIIIAVIFVAKELPSLF